MTDSPAKKTILKLLRLIAHEFFQPFSKLFIWLGNLIGNI